MKYLGLHKLIWALLCLIYLFMALIVYAIINVVYFLWSFKFIKYEVCFGYGEYVRTESFFDYVTYDDKNPKETFLRYYHNIF